MARLGAESQSRAVAEPPKQIPCLWRRDSAHRPSRPGDELRCLDRGRAPIRTVRRTRWVRSGADPAGDDPILRRDFERRRRVCSEAG